MSDPAITARGLTKRYDDTVVVECDCLLDLGVTGVELAARRAASARAG